MSIIPPFDYSCPTTPSLGAIKADFPPLFSIAYSFSALFYLYFPFYNARQFQLLMSEISLLSFQELRAKDSASHSCIPSP